MGYDIGIGICSLVEPAHVTVRLDNAMVSKLLPGRPWHRSGISVLRFDRRLCSARHAPAVGSEIYLEHDRIAAHAQATLDVDGTGAPERIDLGLLLVGMDPDPPAHAAAARSKR